MSDTTKKGFLLVFNDEGLGMLKCNYCEDIMDFGLFTQLRHEMECEGHNTFETEMSEPEVKFCSELSEILRKMKSPHKFNFGDELVVDWGKLKYHPEGWVFITHIPENQAWICTRGEFIGCERHFRPKIGLFRVNIDQIKRKP